jgi:hypothetical protein
MYFHEEKAGVDLVSTEAADKRVGPLTPRIVVDTLLYCIGVQCPVGL